MAACEQCGRNRVPAIHPVRAFGDWIGTPPADDAECFVLSLIAGAEPGAGAALAGRAACVLSGPEGGLSAAEEQQAIARGFAPLSLGPRVLRAETAALVALAWLAGR